MITIIDYGAGNLASIVNGLKKVGAQVEITSEPKKLKNADAIVLPGVGSFGDAMEKITAFKPAIVEATESGKPFLGVCLGVQLLMDSSDESPGVEGLKIFSGDCKRFTGKLKIPHMGWNNLEIVNDTPLLQGITDEDYFYFVHSYYVVPNNKSIVAANTKYGTDFPSVISEKNIFATQFHPEKSADKGLKILKNFVELSRK